MYNVNMIVPVLTQRYLLGELEGGETISPWIQNFEFGQFFFITSYTNSMSGSSKPVLDSSLPLLSQVAQFFYTLKKVYLFRTYLFEFRVREF